MTPRKKDRAKTPETITSSVSEESDICSEAENGACPKSNVEEGSCSKSSASDDNNASC